MLSTCWFQERSELRLFVALSQCCQHVGSRKDLSWDFLLLFHSVVNMLVPGKIWDETACCSFTVLSTCWFQENLSWYCLLLFHSVVSTLVPGKIWTETACCSFTVLSVRWFQERSELRLFVALSQFCQHVGSRKDLSWDCLLLFHSVVNMLIPGEVWAETFCCSFTVLSTWWFQERS